MADMPIRLRSSDSLQAASISQTWVPPRAPYGRSNVGIMFDLDCRPFGAMVLQVLGTFTGVALSVEATPDGKTWALIQGVPMTGSTTAGTWPGSSSASGTAYVYPLWGVRVRVRIAAITSGKPVVFPIFREGWFSPLVPVGGVTGHGTAIHGGPVRIGARALSGSYAAVTTGQAADLISTLDGRLIVLGNAIPENTWNYPAAAGGIVNTTDVAIKAAGAAGVRNYVSTLSVKNVSAVASEWVVKDGSTVLWRGQASASMAVAETLRFDPPLRGTAATALNFAMVTTGTQTYANATGFIGA